MDKKSLRICYMGTPSFAVEPLKQLVEGGYNVVGVITMPDKPAGRGHRLHSSPVKEYALTQEIPLLQPERLKDESFLDALKEWNADLQIVVAFRMLPEVVWAMPRLGTFNLHASLLPQYRGAAPINWAIINGETETGITTFFLDHEIDTGKMIDRVKVEITPDDNAGTLHDKMMIKGGELVLRTVEAIRNNNYQTTAQEALISHDKNLKAAPKIFKETCFINWNSKAHEVHNFVRGLSPYPTALATFEIEEEQLTAKVFATEWCNADHDLSTGTLSIADSGHLQVATVDGFVKILELQFPGKKRVFSDEWLRGFRKFDALKAPLPSPQRGETSD